MPISSAAYAPDKALAHPGRLKVLKAGGDIYPVHLHLIISDLCNLDCGGCAYRMSGYSSNQLFGVRDALGVVNNNPARFLETELVKQILRDCVAMGTKAVEFTGGGEPTVHPDAPELLAYAQTLGLETALITNGLKLDRMGSNPVRTKWLRISIDAATAETFDLVRPGFGGTNGWRFDAVLTALEKMRVMRDSLKTDCVIGAGFVVQKDNWHELYDAVRLFRAYGADNVRISGLFSPEGDAYFADFYEKAAELERLAVKHFARDDFRVYGRFHEKVADLAASPDYATCHYQDFTTYIGGDGNLYRCCVTSYNEQGLIGSVAEKGFKALWDETHEKRNNFDARSCPKCQFNDRNKAIAGALATDTLPDVPSTLVHPNFV